MTRWAGLALATGALSLLSASCAKHGVIAPGVTKAGIRKVALRMSESQVVAILGPPLRRIDPTPDMPTRVLLEYTEGGPRLWVHMEGGRSPRSMASTTRCRSTTRAYTS